MLEVDYITNRVFNSRTYILSRPDCKKVWLVDCGDTDRVLELIGGKTIEGVLLTHTHSDHIYGLEELIEQFPKVKIYSNAFGAEALRSPKLNLSSYHSEYPEISIDSPENVRIITEEDQLEVLYAPVLVYETPGHDISCLTYIIENNAFTGDSYIPGVKVFTGFPHSNRRKAQESITRIIQLTKGKKVCQGHTVHPFREQECV